MDSSIEIFLVDLPIHNFDLLSDALFDTALRAVDVGSQQRVQRFYRKEDAWRCLIGRILPLNTVRRLMDDKQSEIMIQTTATGKPFVASPILHPPFGFNISHDGSIVLMGTRRASTGNLANSIGVDVMRIHIPANEAFPTFLESLEATLTPGEQAYLLDSSSVKDAALTALFDLWTIKESYTKALGRGLGFDFSRVEYDFRTRILSVDGQPLCGWFLGVFHFEVEGNNYVGATCHRLEEDSTPCVVETLDIQGAPWCRRLSASQVIEEAVPFVQ